MDSLRTIDLPAELVSADCLICEAMGQRVTARFLDREGGPVCEECFGLLLRMEAMLRMADRAEAMGGRSDG